MSSDIETLYKQAEKAEKVHDYEAALECYQKILQQDAQEDHAYYCLANVYAIRGLVPQVVQQYLKLADILEGKGQLDGAVEVCQWVISIEPTGTQARAKLIDLFEKQSKKKEAVQQSLILSRIFSALGHGEQSIELLQKRRELDPDNPELILQLGEIYIKQGQIPEGIALYKTIAQELLRREDYNRAVDALKRIKGLRGEDLENLSELGGAYMQLGKLDEAKVEYRQILRQDLNHIGALSQLGTIAKMQGAWDEARLPFRKIVELDPGNAFGRENYAEVNEVLGNQVEAVKHYLVAAEAYEKSGETAKAVEIYQNILALDPEHGAARNRLETLAAPVVPRKRVSAEQVLARQRPFSKPLALPSEEVGGTAEAEDTISGLVAAVGEDAAGEPEEEQPAAAMEGGEGEGKETPETKWILKPGLKSKITAFEGKPPFIAKPKGVSTPPPAPEGGIPRTKPVGKPILTRLRDVSAAGKPPVQETKEEPQDSPAQQEGVGTKPEEVHASGKPGSIIEEMEFPQAEEGVQAVYVDQGTGEAEKERVEETKPAVAETPAAVEEPVAATLPEPAPEPIPVEAALEAREPAAAISERGEGSPSPFELEFPQESEQPPSKGKFQVGVSASLLDVGDVEQLISQGKVDAAIRLCTEALKEAPGDRSVKAILGEIYYRHGLLEEALDCLKEVALDSGDARLLAMLSEIHLLMGHGDEWAESMVACADAERSAGHIQKGLEAVNQVLCWNPNHVKARRLLVSILKELNLNSLSIYHNRILIESLEAANALGDLIPVYQEILESRSDAYPIRYKLALCYQELGKVPEAKQEFVFLSTLFGAQGQRDKEAEYLERALSLDPADVGVMQRLRDVNQHLGRKEAVMHLELKLGDAAMAKGELDSALASYRKVLETDPENEECMDRVVQLYIRKDAPDQALAIGKRLGDLYVRNNEGAKAVSLYQDLLKLDQENVALHRGLAMLYSQGRQTQEAIQEFLTLGHLASAKAQFDDAIDAYRQVLSLDGAHKDARYQMGVILADHKNNWEAALAEFKKVKGLDPHHTAALSRLVKGYAEQGNIEAALQYVQDLIRLDPQNKGMVEELARDVESKLKKDSENAPLRFNFGILCRELGDLDKAIKEFQVVMRKSPELSLRAYTFQGLCWEEKAVRENEETLYQTALKVYKKGMELKGYKDEEYLELKYAMARLHEKLGRLQEAISLYQEIVSVDMEYRDARDRKKQLEEEVSSGKVTRLPASRRQESGS